MVDVDFVREAKEHYRKSDVLHDHVRIDANFTIRVYKRVSPSIDFYYNTVKYVFSKFDDALDIYEVDERSSGCVGNMVQFKYLRTVSEEKFFQQSLIENHGEFTHDLFIELFDAFIDFERLWDKS